MFCLFCQWGGGVYKYGALNIEGGTAEIRFVMGSGRVSGVAYITAKAKKKAELGGGGRVGHHAGANPNGKAARRPADGTTDRNST